MHNFFLLFFLLLRMNEFFFFVSRFQGCNMVFLLNRAIKQCRISFPSSVILLLHTHTHRQKSVCFILNKFPYFLGFFFVAFGGQQCRDTITLLSFEKRFYCIVCPGTSVLHTHTLFYDSRSSTTGNNCFLRECTLPAALAVA